jgi:hypothetical protein
VGDGDGDHNPWNDPANGMEYTENEVNATGEALFSRPREIGPEALLSLTRINDQ